MNKPLVFLGFVLPSIIFSGYILYDSWCKIDSELTKLQRESELEMIIRENEQCFYNNRHKMILGPNYSIPERKYK